MIWQRILFLAATVALGAGAWRAGGGMGLAFLGSGLGLWVLLYYTRLVTIMHRAAERPLGYVDSAVMLNAKLRPRLSLMHVIALTRSIGERLSEVGAEPEIYRWSDAGESHVTVEFENGRVARWNMVRPPTEPETTASAETAAASPHGA